MPPLSPEMQKQVEAWTQPPFDEATRKEVQALIDSDDTDELTDRFYKNLDFGTGGLRGKLGAGPNRMNQYTVGQATQGLANYLLKHNTKPGFSVVVSYDSRHRSDEFAREVASVFTGNGIGVFLFESLRPVPELSFATRLLGAKAGVMITASHNPPEYNGYKVYWADGCQVVPPHDKGIIAEAEAIQGVEAVKRLGFEEALEKGLVQMVGEKVDSAYIEAILPLSIRPEICREMAGDLGIVYTPVHGTGIKLVPDCLERWGFKNVNICEAQREPDGDFPTTHSPNPEEREALEAAIKTAEEKNADLVLATDPDADRVGIAVKHNGKFHLLSGNQIAAMLVDYVISEHAARGSLVANAAVVKTIVTTELIAAICEHHDVRLDNVLTGFKYIGEKIGQWQESGEAQYMVGGEESYGYLVGTHARDKDAVVCCCFIAEMAACSRKEGKTLVDRMNDIYKAYGIFHESLESIKREGTSGREEIDHIMSTFRDAPPAKIGGSKVTTVIDYQNDDTGLPKSNVLLFRNEKNDQVVARPSGTEPKIKFYFGVRDTDGVPIKEDAVLEERRQAVLERHDTIRKDFLAQVEKILGA